MHSCRFACIRRLQVGGSLWPLGHLPLAFWLYLRKLTSYECASGAWFAQFEASGSTHVDSMESWSKPRWWWQQRGRGKACTPAWKCEVLVMLLLAAAADAVSAQAENTTRTAAGGTNSPEGAGNTTTAGLEPVPLTVMDYRTFVQDGRLDVANFTTKVEGWGGGWGEGGQSWCGPLHSLMPGHVQCSAAFRSDPLPFLRFASFHVMDSPCGGKSEASAFQGLCSSLG